MPDFTHDELFSRRALRLAQLLFDHWEEQSHKEESQRHGFNTDLLKEPFIKDHWVMRGRSERLASELAADTTEGVIQRREHIVPRVLIARESLKMIAAEATVEMVRDAIVRNLGIVMVTAAEANHLDHTLKWKMSMPPGWRFNIDDPMQRLKEAGINVVEFEVQC
jgi:hypothetical protein